jgi:hypothetical protein
MMRDEQMDMMLKHTMGSLGPLTHLEGSFAQLTAGTGFPTGVVGIGLPVGWVILHWNAVWY